MERHSNYQTYLRFLSAWRGLSPAEKRKAAKHISKSNRKVWESAPSFTTNRWM